MEFEKWQALGNDYVIVEAAQLPFELTPGRIRAICAAHTGVGADGILLLSAPEQPGHVARLRIFNPDGSEAELSGNGAREAVLYLRRHHWTDEDSFRVQTAAGEIRPQVISDTEVTIDLGRARVQSPDYPSGAEDGRGELIAGGRTWRFQHVQVGNPQCAIRIANGPGDGPERGHGPGHGPRHEHGSGHGPGHEHEHEHEQHLDALDLRAIGPEIERHELFPNRTNVSWFAELEPGRIRARIFERGVGETSASGTGATGAAVAYVLDGGSSPVTVTLDGGELMVEVAENLQIKLSGWAVPVFRGRLAEAFLEELHATQ